VLLMGLGSPPGHASAARQTGVRAWNRCCRLPIWSDSRGSWRTRRRAAARGPPHAAEEGGW